MFLWGKWVEQKETERVYNLLTQAHTNETNNIKKPSNSIPKLIFKANIGELGYQKYRGHLSLQKFYIIIDRS